MKFTGFKCDICRQTINNGISLVFSTTTLPPEDGFILLSTWNHLLDNNRDGECTEHICPKCIAECNKVLKENN